MTGMTAVLTKAAAFVLIIVTGYLLKKKGGAPTGKIL